MLTVVNVYFAAALQALAAEHTKNGTGIFKRNVIKVYPMDVADEISIDSAFAAIEADFPAIDALINNAGITKRPETALTVRKADLTSIFETNVVGPMLVTQKALPLLRKSEHVMGPKVIFVSTLMASITRLETEGKSGCVSYRSTKAALNMAVKCLVAEVPDVSMVLAHPGWVATDMGNSGGRSAPVTVEQSAERLLAYLTRMSIEHTGKFFDVITDEELPW